MITPTDETINCSVLAVCAEFDERAKNSIISVDANVPAGLTGDIVKAIGKCPYFVGGEMVGSNW